MARIDPIVGRHVLFHLGGSIPSDEPARVSFTPGNDDTYAAIIVHVESPTLVNLAVFDSYGNSFGRTSIPLIQEEENPPAGAYCEWMKYQKEVASGQIPPTLHAVNRPWGESEETTHPAIVNATPLDNYGAPIRSATETPNQEHAQTDHTDDLPF